jgi:hypothetical protein
MHVCCFELSSFELALKLIALNLLNSSKVSRKLDQEYPKPESVYEKFGERRSEKCVKGP